MTALYLGLLCILIPGAAVYAFTGDATHQVQVSALLALSYMWLGLVCDHIKALRRKNAFIEALRGASLAATGFFAVIHALQALFTQLGGIDGLWFLSSKYQWAILSSSSGFILLILYMGLHRVSWAARYLSALSVLSHMAGMLFLIHALQLGAHFTSLTGLLPQLAYGALTVLCVLVAMRIERWLYSRIGWRLQFGVLTICMLLLMGAGAVKTVLPSNSIYSQDINIHAMSAQENDQLNERFNVSFVPPAAVLPGQPVRLAFIVHNAHTGEKIELFQDVQYKVPRLVIVSDDLSEYKNIPLDQRRGELFADAAFSDAGNYRLYIDYQPFGSKEQVAAFSLSVGDQGMAGIAPPEYSYQAKYEATVGPYTIYLKNPRTLDSGKVFAGQEVLRFGITDNRTGHSVTRVEHYLGRWGTLAIINTQSLEYIYSAMTSHDTGAYDATNDTMILDYTLSGHYGPAKPGWYKIWADFKMADGTVISGDFMILVQ